MTIFWQILAFGLIVALVLLLIFAIVEPGPLQKPRTFGRPSRQNGRQAAAPESEHSRAAVTESAEAATKLPTDQGRDRS